MLCIDAWRKNAAGLAGRKPAPITTDIEASPEGNYYVEADGKKRPLTSLERRLLFDKQKELLRDEANLENRIGGLRASIAGS